jgi:hypothetical protein
MYTCGTHVMCTTCCMTYTINRTHMCTHTYMYMYFELYPSGVYDMHTLWYIKKQQQNYKIEAST